MAPNGTSRKAPAVTKTEKAENGVPLDHLFDDLSGDADLEQQVDAGKSLPSAKVPGKWDAETNNGTKEIKPSSGARSSSPPPITKVSSNITKGFANSKPMADKAEILKCTHCKRAVSKHTMPKHVESCLNKKQEKQRKKKEAKDARDAAARKEKNGTAAGDSEDEDDDAEGKKGIASKTGSKKRKAGEEGEEAASGPAKKKKKKEDNKAKAPRPKAPVDVEKQCGVELPQGGQCARSLTCKSHSMGAKRAVPGRSAPYDKLLAEYQRKNQAKLQKAQFDASAPNPDDENLPSGPVDSEEEKEGVMAGIANFGAHPPIWQHSHVPLKSRYKYNRMQATLDGARRGGIGLFGGSGGFFGGVAQVGNTMAGVPTVDDQGIVHARRGSVVPGARSMMAPGGSRKSSMAT